jgi:hypothetical protein
MRRLLIYIFQKIKLLAELNNRYKIRLITMLTTIFIIFVGTLIYIIHSKTIMGFDPLILNINTTTFLGKIITSSLFGKFAHFIFLP